VNLHAPLRIPFESSASLSFKGGPLCDRLTHSLSRFFSVYIATPDPNISVLSKVLTALLGQKRIALWGIPSCKYGL